MYATESMKKKRGLSPSASGGRNVAMLTTATAVMPTGSLTFHVVAHPKWSFGAIGGSNDEYMPP